MLRFTIALLQMTACADDQQANLAKGEAFCRRAREMGADLALFPEMWNVGYTSCYPRRESTGDIWRAPERWQPGETLALSDEAARERWMARAIGRDDPFVLHFRALAKELDMAIALTYLERWPGAPRNTVSLIDRHGEIALTYAKVHTCDFDEPEGLLTSGDDFYVCVLDTAQGPVQIGAMICYDREFPESARVLMLKGAEIIITPNACTMEANRLRQFRVRALENMVGVALTNYAAPQDNGHSVAYDPIGFGINEQTRDTLIVEAGEQEGVYLAPFDLEALRDYRQREAWGNAFRKPSRYGVLTSREVAPPFLRVNAQGEPYHERRGTGGS
ncbi:MAG TPA: carbon-nitrogen hydrolase family protein [Ktedonobacterales bacterium]|jgi:predicted amidohydrolase